MVTKGADVVFHAAGGTGIGVIDGCKENKIWAIGVDSDQSATYAEQPEIQKPRNFCIKEEWVTVSTK